MTIGYAKDSLFGVQIVTPLTCYDFQVPRHWRIVQLWFVSTPQLHKKDGKKLLKPYEY